METPWWCLEDTCSENARPLTLGLRRQREACGVCLRKRPILATPGNHKETIAGCVNLVAFPGHSGTPCADVRVQLLTRVETGGRLSPNARASATVGVLAHGGRVGGRGRRLRVAPCRPPQPAARPGRTARASSAPTSPWTGLGSSRIYM